MVPVRSRVIVAIGYNAVAHELWVHFRSRYIYVYAGVPDAVFDAFLEAPSKGRFYNRRIRRHYLSARLR